MAETQSTTTRQSGGDHTFATTNRPSDSAKMGDVVTRLPDGSWYDGTGWHDVIEVTATITGMTTTTPDYDAGDQIGLPFEFANVAAASGGSVRILDFQIVDSGPTLDSRPSLHLFRDEPTGVGNNNALSFWDDADRAIGVAFINTRGDNGLLWGSKYADDNNPGFLPVELKCVARSVWGILVAGTGASFVASASNAFTVRMLVERLTPPDPS